MMPNSMASRKDTILILGGRGMLGQELVRVFQARTLASVVGWDRDTIDVTDFATLETKIRALLPSIIINAVAYNAVDLCETSEAEYKKAALLNTEVPKRLAQLASAVDAKFVHYSTDYVFDGTKEVGYREEAKPKPLSRYGLTKWEGEQAVLATAEEHFVIRLSKLFGHAASSADGKQSFFEKMLALSEGKTEVSVVDGERSCFTYAPDLAEATRTLLEDGAAGGVYHLANEGAATWYQAACELFALVKPDIAVRAVPPEAFPRPAKRPAYSELLNTKRPALRDYRVALREFVAEK